jgi:hypothetical protein
MGWLRRLLGDPNRNDRDAHDDGDTPRRAAPAPAAARSGERVSGDPPSGNGASSMHLFWTLAGNFAAAEVTVEVLDRPTADRLYFWAFQASFTDGHRTVGGAHLGLQWHPDYPYSAAVNWGGYRSGGGELAGSMSALPGSLGNPHTRDYHWSIGVPYRLRIDRSPDTVSAWRGSFHDPVRNQRVVIRELRAGGTHLCSLMTWSEIFARCEDPPVTVRWSDPVAFDDAGRAVRPHEMSVNYQSHHDGGCANTTAFVDDHGICQRSATDRIVPQGARLALPSYR